METKAILKHARISADKARLVADQVRGKKVDSALDLLKFSNKKAATLIQKVLKSAIANAENNDGADIDELWISSICVDGGPMFKRVRPRARGRSDRILKRTSHITVKVADSKGI